MTIMRALASIAVAAAVLSSPATAQQRIDRVPGRAAQPGQDRAGLEQRLRERLAEVVRRRLNLNDAQMRQLGQVNDRYERERMMLLRQERQMRQQLRAEVLAGDSADQTKVSELLDRALRIQRQRLDITEREQRDLSAFMTPVQRAMYVGIQDDLRRRVEEMRQNRRPGAAALGARRPPL
jgi:hypothetical protein